MVEGAENPYWRRTQMGPGRQVPHVRRCQSHRLHPDHPGHWGHHPSHPGHWVHRSHRDHQIHSGHPRPDPGPCVRHPGWPPARSGSHLGGQVRGVKTPRGVSPPRWRHRGRWTASRSAAARWWAARTLRPLGQPDRPVSRASPGAPDPNRLAGVPDRWAACPGRRSRRLPSCVAGVGGGHLVPR